MKINFKLWRFTISGEVVYNQPETLEQQVRALLKRKSEPAPIFFNAYIEAIKLVRASQEPLMSLKLAKEYVDRIKEDLVLRERL